MDNEMCNTKHRKLDYMKNNMKKRNNKEKNIFPITGNYIIVELMKKQNLEFLKKIGSDMIKNDEDREIFIEKYSKLCYVVPNVIDDHRKEELQNFIL
jgi:hypothetical protein